MILTFYKYQGTGNDFVLVDNRKFTFPKENINLVASLCDRKFGIGADGLILLENDEMSDFKMIYYNSDGNQSSMCGNGGRCIVAFANFLGIMDKATSFTAIDGIHKATIDKNTVSLQMQDVSEIHELEKHCFLDTGSPHHVQLVNNLDAFEVAKEGKRIRYGLYGKKGSNINFVQKSENGTFTVRTYERGVENETLSCGTGVTAVALAMYRSKLTNTNKVQVKTLGGDLEVSFEPHGTGFKNICLTGPARQVFKGEITC
ncbi:diaminopimelate epimerase [Costertonia aggregata]|uniref:Diaminopimelate epimerase n=1 Tax=Costertonia aggregata TaxID=343403 RepID=A0A7H9AKK4_9FLAO|nr:diaminopimelate epimerase [Costertonia aggregata]QLG43873.1 diaminopimelate epimerase [Costertonia aggregata]